MGNCEVGNVELFRLRRSIASGLRFETGVADLVGRDLRLHVGFGGLLECRRVFTFIGCDQVFQFKHPIVFAAADIVHHSSLVVRPRLSMVLQHFDRSQGRACQKRKRA